MKVFKLIVVHFTTQLRNESKSLQYMYLGMFMYVWADVCAEEDREREGEKENGTPHKTERERTA